MLFSENFNGYFGECKFQNLECRTENVPQYPETFGKQFSSNNNDIKIHHKTIITKAV